MTEAIKWRVAWVDPKTAEDHVEVLELVAAGMLVGSLMARGVGVISVHDNTLWHMFRQDEAEAALAGLGKSS